MATDEYLLGEKFEIGANEFARPGVEEKFPRDREFMPEHLLLELWFDWKEQMVSGSVTHTLRAINDGLQRVVMDAVDMKIKGVTSNGRALEFDYDGRLLTINLLSALKSEERITISISYEARPKCGLFFIKPDEKYPNKPYQIWSQGEMEDNRYWFPAYDYPNARVVSEAILHVDERFTALSNGRLLSVKHDKAKREKVYHWRQAIPHVNYLVTVVIGEFDMKEEICDGVPLQYYVPRGYGRLIPLSFRYTPSIMKFFNKITGVKFPYEKYAQVVVYDFTFGGMENTTLTTLYEATLHDRNALPDFRVESLISHEMAHQWFGDLITTKSWSHLWLNEGFATYFQPLWYENEFGKDEFHYAMRTHAKVYFEEANERYMRPIVTTKYTEPEDMFDAHSYQKGAWVLNMMRFLLGDEPFFRAIRHYLKRHMQGVVETTDLKEAVEEATGRDLEWFFKEWVYSPGHPVFEVSWSFNPDLSTIVLTIKQTQKNEKDVPIFRMPVEIVWMVDGKIERKRVEITGKEHTFYLPAKKRPKCVLFDPEGWILKVLKFKKEKDELIYQLKNAPYILGRIEACEELSKIIHDNEVVDELGKALKSDRFYGVRVSAAQALGKIGTPAAKEKLLSGMNDTDSRVRRAVYESLGNFRDEDTLRILEKAFKKEKKYYPCAGVLMGMGKTRIPAGYDMIVKGLSRASHNDIIASSVFNALGELKDERGIELAKKYSTNGYPINVRRAAISCLGTLGDIFEKRQREICEFLIPLLKDRNHNIRSAVISSLAVLGDASAIPHLTPISEGETLGLLRRTARNSIQRIRKKDAETKAQKADFARELEEIKKENRDLKIRIEKIEEQLKALTEKSEKQKRKNRGRR